MNTTTTYPTLGEMIQFIYDASGILPRKDASDSYLDEKDKKNLQKALSRLSHEEGDINKNISNLICTLIDMLQNYINSKRITCAIYEIFVDIFQNYREILTTEATFLNKKQSLQYFLSSNLIPRFAFSVKKHTLSYNLATENLIFPYGYWFLPSFTEHKIVMPLQKVMNWIYQEYGLKQKEFHDPANLPTQSDHELIKRLQNLDSAQNWIKDKYLPSLPSLLSNFNAAFDLHDKINSNNPQTAHRQSFIINLIIARISNYIFDALIKHYGIEYAKACCQEYQCQTSFVDEDFFPLCKCIDETSFLISKDISPDAYPSEMKDQLIYDFVHHHYEQYADQVLNYIKLPHNKKKSQIPSSVESYLNNIGQWSTHLLINLSYGKFSPKIPDHFADFFFEGMDLKNSAETTTEQIKNFEIRIKENNIAHLLPWLLPWIKGAYHYRKKDYQHALPYFDKAFNHAKYCAGRHQYKLVNQFAEIAAKTNKRKQYNKAISWASYLGFEIRWLRKDEPTKEKLDFVYYMMQIANYSHQL